jgi:RHH-type transcriptional regulator, rel operon repressor / antitoxin RelB
MAMSTLFSFRIDDALKEKLGSLAEATQRSKSFLAAEAIQRYVEEEAWQVSEIMEGAKQAREAGTVPDEEAQAWMTSLGTRKPLPRPRPKKRTRA